MKQYPEHSQTRQRQRERSSRFKNDFDKRVHEFAKNKLGQDLSGEVYRFLSRQIQVAIASGITRDKVVITLAK